MPHQVGGGKVKKMADKYPGGMGAPGIDGAIYTMQLIKGILKHVAIIVEL